MPDNPITPTRLQQIKALFDELVELSPAAWDTRLAEAAGDDLDLMAEVRSLLAVHAQTVQALDDSLSDRMRASISRTEVDLSGQRVGPYELVRRIGIGGMGTVYEATRVDDQFRKQVAIKFLRRGVESEVAVRRFRYERQILANLTHRNIAALLDGGVTPEGQPYFVMEYVAGEPITHWALARHLSVTERVRLMIQVCTAVQHAHQSLVVHRDLKPGNILVADDGTVKLLDFGIAKLLREEEGIDQLPPTQGGARALTPEYASPEQVRGLAVGTTSDVYALGVVLFEMLTGTIPFVLRGKLFAEIEQIVSQQPPPKPSSVLTPERATALGERSVSRARSRLTGDLDAIVLTALRKEPERRYGSAEQLARDLRAWLDGLPVSARPDKLGYRFTKFVQRRRIEVAAATLAIASLIGGVAATTMQARTAQVERTRATEIKDFLTTMLGAANPGSMGRDITMREVLDSALTRVDALAGQPQLEAEVRGVIADTYLALGDYQVAHEQYSRAVALLRSEAPAGDYPTAVMLGKLALASEFLGTYQAADSTLTEAELLLRRTAKRGDPAVAHLLERRASLQQELGDLASAEVIQRQALATREQFTPDDDAGLATSLNNLAIIVGQQGQTQLAESLHVEALHAVRRAFGDDHPEVAGMLAQHAFALEMDGQVERSDTAYREALEMRRRLLGAEHPDYAWTLFQYAQFLMRRERWTETAQYARQVLALRGRSLPESHPAVSTALQTLGVALSHSDSLAAAERYLRESLELRRTTLPPGNWLVASGEGVLGEYLTKVGRFAEAERLLLGAESQLVATRGVGSPQVADTRRRLAALYRAWKRPVDAQRWETRP
jgi:serine/threonine-protein kinase